MTLIDSPVLYSTNTWLAYQISKKYYQDLHWVWCTPNFDARSVLERNAPPPSSAPGDIYRELREATSRGDRHNSKIAANKVGILKGVAYKHRAGVVNDEQAKDIVSAVEASELIDFRPLLYVIPVNQEVSNLAKEVPILEKAHPLSVEYLIEKIPRKFFDIIEPY